MRAAYASAINVDDPLAGLTVGEQPEPTPEEGWVSVEVRASSLNHHDLWSLRGVGLPADRLPMILGCDAAGVDDAGNAVRHLPGLLDPLDQRGFSLLSERYPGTLADRVAVPRENLIPMPTGVSFTDAACLPTAWLTAYHMLDQGPHRRGRRGARAGRRRRRRDGGGGPRGRVRQAGVREQP